MATIQIAVRLEDKYVAFLDEQVAAGHARSRADLVESALERAMRQRLYEDEIARFLSAADDPELDAWVGAAADDLTMDD